MTQSNPMAEFDESIDTHMAYISDLDLAMFSENHHLDNERNFNTQGLIDQLKIAGNHNKNYERQIEKLLNQIQDRSKMVD